LVTVGQKFSLCGKVLRIDRFTLLITGIKYTAIIVEQVCKCQLPAALSLSPVTPLYYSAALSLIMKNGNDRKRPLLRLFLRLFFLKNVENYWKFAGISARFNIWPESLLTGSDKSCMGGFMKWNGYFPEKI